MYIIINLDPDLRFLCSDKKPLLSKIQYLTCMYNKEKWSKSIILFWLCKHKKQLTIILVFVQQWRGLFTLHAGSCSIAGPAASAPEPIWGCTEKPLRQYTRGKIALCHTMYWQWSATITCLVPIIDYKSQGSPTFIFWLRKVLVFSCHILKYTAGFKNWM